MEIPTLLELSQKYVQYCYVMRNYSPVTIAGYRSSFSLLFKDTAVLYAHQLTKDVLEKWFFEGRLNRKWSSVTFRHHHKRINTFLAWLQKEGQIPFNFAVLIEKPRLEKRLPKTLSKEQAQLILDAAFHMRYTYRFERFRNRAIIGLMVLAGLRKSEVMHLKMNDVSLETRMIFISQGKGHKDRMVPINFRLHVFLVEYLKDRTRLKKQSLFFFTGAQYDRPISNHCLKLLIQKLRNKTKVDFSAHTLRHGFARLMLEGGCDIYTLSKMMGHNRITTTTIYLSCSSQQMSRSIELHALN